MPVRTAVTVGDNLMRAILAMDSYNRGYAQGLRITPQDISDVGQFIGTARIVAQDISPTARSAGFYASAYSWNGETIISYRGTDYDSDAGDSDFLSTITSTDIWSGWTIGLGYAGAHQAQLALQFYQQVAGVTNFYFNQPDVTLLGHSLGGGLAGFVGALAQQPVYGYDHMPFGAAAYAQAISDSARAAADELGLEWSEVTAVLLGAVVDPINIVIGAFTFARFLEEFEVQYELRAPVLQMAGHHIDGEILELVRSGTIQNIVGGAGTLAAVMQGGLPGLGLEFLLGVTGLTLGYSVAQFEQYPNMSSMAYPAYATGAAPYSENLSAVERHSMAYQAMVIYGNEQLPLERPDISFANWTLGFTYVASGLFDAEIGRSFGLARGVTGRSEPENQMAMMIAYSAVDVGVMPFGNTAIQSLFDDSNDLGRGLNFFGAPTALAAGGNGIGNVVTEFAALLARQSILESTRPEAIEGIIFYRTATQARGETLMIDLRQSTWDGYGVVHNIVSIDNMIEGFIQADIIEGPQILNRIERFYANANGGQDILAVIDRVSISLGGPLPPTRLAGDGVLLSVLADDGGSSSYTGGTDFVIGGEGDDILFGLNGDDILIGGRGGDELDGGNGRDFLYGGTGNDILRGGEHADELWSGPAFGFDGEFFSDELYGGGGNDRLVFANGAGVAVGGAANDVIDARLAVEAIEVRYSLGDGSDRLAYDRINQTQLVIDPYTVLLGGPAAGNVYVHFTDLSMQEVIIQWDVTLLQEQLDEYSGATERLCVGIMRVLSIGGVELMNLGEVAGIVSAYGWAPGASTRFAIMNHPQLLFTDGYFSVGEGPNPNFHMNFVGPVSAPEIFQSSVTETTDFLDVSAFLDPGPPMSPADWADAMFVRPNSYWFPVPMGPQEFLL